jgi:hypothetical protein
VQVSVYCKETKKKEQTCFFIEKEALDQERKKTIQARKISQFKSVKALAIAW